jgi:rubredoxin
MTEHEWWLCSECRYVERSDKWGGDDSTAICPNCKFEHHDNEMSAVYGGTELEMQRQRRELLQEDES